MKFGLLCVRRLDLFTSLIVLPRVLCLPPLKATDLAYCHCFAESTAPICSCWAAAGPARLGCPDLGVARQSPTALQTHYSLVAVSSCTANSTDCRWQGWH